MKRAAAAVRRRLGEVTLAVATLMEACGSSTPSSPTPSTSKSTSPISRVVVAGIAPAVGATSPYTATAVRQDGAIENVTSQSTWTSANPAVATVSPTGIVTGVAVGQVLLTATFQGTSGSATASVTASLCGVAPGPTNQQLPRWISPFQGEFRLSNYFDHEYPLLGGDSVAYQLSPCGERLSNRSMGHAGVDYTMPIGTPIFAVADGEVTFSGLENPHICTALGGQSLADTAVEIRHPSDGNQFGSRYVHLSFMDVERGQRVTQGQQIGLSGNVGCSTTPHLHFAAWRFTNTNRGGQTAIDPYGWEGSGPDPWAGHPMGAQSLWLWMPDRAPSILR